MRHVDVMSTLEACQSEGCDANAVYRVELDGREKLVCRKCAHEMVDYYGWKLS